MARPIPVHKLNNGVEIPLLGFGTFAKGRVDGESYAAVTAALEAGYRHFDCAWRYNNEDEIGAALRDWMAKNPSVTRKDIFITTKVWLHFCNSAEDIEGSLDESLRRLGMDYVDCFLIHWPIVAEKTETNEPKMEAGGKYVINEHLTAHTELLWPWAENVYKTGKTRSIGVSNWTVKRLEKLLAIAEVKPVVNQFEIHPFFPNTKLVNYCLEHDILPVAFSPLGSQHPMPVTGERLTTNPELLALAAKKGVTVAQLVIAWGLKRGYGVLPKSSTPERIRTNFQLVDLSDEEFAEINERTAGRENRFVDMQFFGYDVDWE